MSAIKTYTGIMFDPLDPKQEQIDIRDIAHALSMLCRANGHFQSFYSVGQHCINCAAEAAARGYSARIQLGCLLHDGSETYLSDVTRPVKEILPVYLEIEKPLQNAIWNKWIPDSLTERETRQIFEIDDAMLLHEFVVLMDTQLSEQIPELLSKPQFQFHSFSETEAEYLKRFAELTKGCADK